MKILALLLIGVTVLAVTCWRLSVWAWRSRTPDDVARGADVPTYPDLYERRNRYEGRARR